MFIDTTILLVRHGEKPGDPGLDAPQDGPNLSPAGWQRAQAYVGYFNQFVATSLDADSQARPIAVDYIFASADHYQTSYRPRLTISPFADQPLTPRPLSSCIPDGNYKDLVEQLKGPDYDGKNILICWHHGTIVDLASCLLTADGQYTPPPLPETSCWPPNGAKWPKHEFGWLFQICFDSQGQPDADWTRCVNEKLMPDDTREPCNGWPTNDE